MPPHDPISPPLEVDCRTVHARLAGGDDLILLDCRERDEYELVRIDPAMLLPMSEIPHRAAELEPHRQRAIVVYCHHGGRSLRVAAWLRNQGYASAQSLAGGIDRWAEEIDRSLARY
ncbi:MAG: rhodanese-like domain-containing protein [Planctomycetales bacterium]